MALDSYQYGDPARVIEIKQERAKRDSCAGCMFLVELMGKQSCEKKRKPKRCRDYKERD